MPGYFIDILLILIKSTTLIILKSSASIIKRIIRLISLSLYKDERGVSYLKGTSSFNKGLSQLPIEVESPKDFSD